MGRMIRAALLLGFAVVCWIPQSGGAQSRAETSPDGAADDSADLSSSDGNARRRAVEQLGRAGGRDAVPLLEHAYDTEAADAFGVKAAAATALGELGVAEAVGPLGRMLADPDYWVRRKATEALGKVPGEAAVRALETALRDEDVRVRAEAVRALGSRTGEGSRAREALGDPDPRVVSAALEALDAAGAAEAAPALAAALTHASRDVRFRAASLLAKRGDDRGLRFLEAAARTPGDFPAALREAGRAGCASVPLLAGLLPEASEERRERLLDVLEAQPCASATDVLVEQATCRECPAPSRIRATQALFERRADLSRAQAGPIEGLLSEEAPDLVALALQILLDSAGTRNLGRIEALAFHDNQVVRHFALANLGKYGSARQEPVLIKALSDANGSNIRLALEGLARFGSTAALPAIRPLAEDRLYRRAAEAAVEAIEARGP
ncbi:MAG: HEAT repeat domain-containing protein [Deltaproteobacteria bacterium]|nr:HEAT repeat domain-containing protein [Deltaproteobacteria bacterium]